MWSQTCILDRCLSGYRRCPGAFCLCVRKDKDGNLVTDLNTCILHDSSGKEIKAWKRLPAIWNVFRKNEEGVRSVPAYYTKLHSRKIVDEDGHFCTGYSIRGVIFVIAVMLIGVVAVSVILIVVSVIKWIQRMIGKS